LSVLKPVAFMPFIALISTLLMIRPRKS
jgi:hypothetical protein